MRLLKAVKRIFNKIKNRLNRFYTLKILFPFIYNWYSKKPVDENKVIFLEIRFEGISNAFTEIYNALKNDYQKFNLVTHNLRLTFVPTRQYNKNCVKFLKDMATAKYVFVNEASNTLSAVKKRKETIVFNTWHGCGAFKKFGFSTADLIFGENEKSMLKYPFYKNMNYVSVSSPEVVWAYEEAMNSKRFGSNITPIGVSRTDIFYKEEYKKTAFEHLYEVMPQAKGKKVIMYAPTFRGRVANAKAPNRLNVELLKYALSDEYVLIIKHHPFVRKCPEVPEYCADFAMDVSELMSIEDMMIVADICISDYSSLVFEYCLMEKPILFLAYDIETYIDWRGFFYPYDELVPGPVVNNTYEVLDFIKDVDNYDKQKVHAFREKFMASCDGHATERILDLVFGENLK